MVYELHKKFGYVAQIHTISDTVLEVIFPQYKIDNRHAPIYVRYEGHGDTITYHEDGRTLEYSGFPPEIFRLAILVDLTIKFKNRNMSPSLSEFIDKDGDTLSVREFEEGLLEILPVVDGEIETEVYLAAFVGTESEHQRQLSSIVTLVECGGFGRYQQA